MKSQQMRIPVVDLYAQYLSIKDQIDDAISSVIRESSFIRGPQVDRFEDAFAALHSVRHCISCANGTDALFIAMKGLGVQSGDEVITTAHSWISTSETISQAGANPVFCDTDPLSYCINPENIESLITERTVGIIPVHLYGHPADMSRIKEIADKYSLWIIEDCAQAHLATFNTRPVGTFGNAATFSFYPGKNLGAMGDAGCILTDDSQLASWCELYARHGGKGQHLMEGINSRLDGLQAAVLNVKLPYLSLWTEQRISAANYYMANLSDNASITLPNVMPGCKHVFHLFTIQTEFRDGLKEHLARNNIDSTINYPVCLPMLPAYARYHLKSTDFPIASGLQSRILSLPLFPEITRDQQDLVISEIKSFNSL